MDNIKQHTKKTQTKQPLKNSREIYQLTNLPRILQKQFLEAFGMKILVFSLLVLVFLVFVWVFGCLGVVFHFLFEDFFEGFAVYF
jgi:Ca2+-dependent lipid-binding protein